MNPNEPPRPSVTIAPDNAPQVHAPAPGQPATPPQPPQPVPKKPSRQGLRDFLSIVAVLASALVLAFALISFVFQSYQVDGPSMQSTLQNSDHLIVWKVARTWARLTHHNYIPKRGDIIIFNEPGIVDASGSGDRQLIKRVIGLPGDHIVIKNGSITIYNKANPRGFDPDKTLPYNKDNHLPITTGNIDLTLGAGQIYVCGDNRTNSYDSRYFGPIDAHNIIGKLVARVLPIGNFERF